MAATVMRSKNVVVLEVPTLENFVTELKIRSVKTAYVTTLLEELPARAGSLRFMSCDFLVVVTAFSGDTLIRHEIRYSQKHNRIIKEFISGKKQEIDDWIEKTHEEIKKRLRKERILVREGHYVLE